MEAMFENMKEQTLDAYESSCCPLLPHYIRIENSIDNNMFPFNNCESSFKFIEECILSEQVEMELKTTSLLIHLNNNTNTTINLNNSDTTSSPPQPSTQPFEYLIIN